MGRVSYVLLLMAVGLVLPLRAFACDGLAVTKGWIRLPPPGMGMTAGYAQLRNTNSATLSVTAVSSPEFDDTTLHRTVEVGGVSRMRPALPLVIEAGAARALEPGGYHLMLMQPGVDLREGLQVSIHFRCEDTTIDIPFTVSKDAP